MSERNFPRFEDFDPRRIDVGSLPLPESVKEQLRALQDLSDDELKARAKDILYTVVGLGVLAFQRAQVLRRDVTEKLETNAPHCADDLTNLVRTIVTRVQDLVPPSRTSNSEA